MWENFKENWFMYIWIGGAVVNGIIESIYYI